MKEGQAKVPVGLFLVAVGAIVLLAAASIWALAPQSLPERLALATVPLQTPGGEMASGASIVSIPDTQPVDEVPVLLPETPLESGALPSFASVSDAPTFFDPTIEGQPVRMVIPDLNVDSAVHRIGLVPLLLEGAQYFQWAVPSGYAAGWHETSAPLGQPGNTVLNGHNNIYGEVFRDLVELEFGDQIILYNSSGQTFTYEVQQRELLAENGQPISVRAENARWIEASEDERLTLVSCWPYATNAYRVIVIAKPATN
jgi:sortase A